MVRLLDEVAGRLCREGLVISTLRLEAELLSTAFTVVLVIANEISQVCTAYCALKASHSLGNPRRASKSRGTGARFACLLQVLFQGEQ
jgi:hypothetical protein